MMTTRMRNRLSALFVGLILAAPMSFAAEEPEIVEHNQMMDHGDGHLMDMEGGMVMGQNKDKLPAGCDKVSEDVKIEVHAGRKYSKPFPGTLFGFDKHEWRVKPCTRLTVTFVNEDNVRHQWMMHGLPKFLYDKGMFHLEVTGPAKVTGTLILPAEDKTYLVHCDIAQHMEKGMKGQLIVGKGSGTFPTIPGITDPAIPDNYGPSPVPGKSSAASLPTNTVNTGAGNSTIATKETAGQPTGSAPAAANTPSSANEPLFSGPLIIGLIVGFIGAPYLFRRIEERCKGKTPAEIIGCVVSLLSDLISTLVKLLTWLIQRLTGKNKLLPKQ
jgi:plastocyanin